MLVKLQTPQARLHALAVPSVSLTSCVHRRRAWHVLEAGCTAGLVPKRFSSNVIFPSPYKSAPRRPDVRAQAGKSAGTKDRLPIFPLGMVALPATECPLHIFEARYRVLFSTLLAGDGGIDDGLVSEDKPWKGTRRFGMAFFDSQAGGLAAVGTVLEVQEHSLLEDGRLLIQNIGRERFRILDVVEERPVLVCDVEYLGEDEDKGEAVSELSQEVAQLFKDVVRLSAKLKDVPVEEGVADPPQLSTLGPRETSFYIASLFAGNPYNQQALLEEDNTKKRLTVEQDLLSGTLKYLSAQVALQSVLGGGGGEAGPSD